MDDIQAGIDTAGQGSHMSEITVWRGAEVMKETEEDQGGLERMVPCAGCTAGSSALDWLQLGKLSREP